MHASKVEDFQDFVDVVNSCGQSLMMKCSDFFDFPEGVCQAKCTREKPNLNKCR